MTSLCGREIILPSTILIHWRYNMLEGFSSAGFVAVGLVIGLAIGFVWGAIRERKGKNKK